MKNPHMEPPINRCSRPSVQHNPDEILPAKAACPHPWDNERRDQSAPLKSLTASWQTSITNPAFVKPSQTKLEEFGLMVICSSLYPNRPIFSQLMISSAKMEAGVGQKVLGQTATLRASSGATSHCHGQRLWRWPNAGATEDERPSAILPREWSSGQQCGKEGGGKRGTEAAVTMSDFLTGRMLSEL